MYFPGGCRWYAVPVDDWLNDLAAMTRSRWGTMSLPRGEDWSKIETEEEIFDQQRVRMRRTLGSEERERRKGGRGEQLELARVTWIGGRRGWEKRKAGVGIARGQLARDSDPSTDQWRLAVEPRQRRHAVRPVRRGRGAVQARHVHRGQQTRLGRVLLPGDHPGRPDEPPLATSAHRDRAQGCRDSGTR